MREKDMRDATFRKNEDLSKEINTDLDQHFEKVKALESEILELKKIINKYHKKLSTRNIKIEYSKSKNELYDNLLDRY